MTSGLPDTELARPARLFSDEDAVADLVKAAATPTDEATDIVDALDGAKLAIDGAREMGRLKPFAVAGLEIFDASAG